ncbi:MAG: phosphoribosylamine--glycine ligase [Myxococcota bacterium]|nr:phosphoribosylamine--glycine ligase [Myxococcota bacterium]
MKVLVIGGGGREHALVWSIARSPAVAQIAVTDRNPGFPADALLVEGEPVAWAVAEGVDLVVVGPEAPLADGIADRLRAAGIPVLGPGAAAAQLESSKAFAKSFMDRHSIPTAGWSVHDNAQSAHDAITGPCVVKADGLAGGKGVIVAQSAAAAHTAVDDVFERFGAAAARVVIEELLIGPEVSIIALCDGTRAVPLLPCRDHKRRYDNDQGPNTGGMGAICPVPGVDADLIAQVHSEVLAPTVAGMAAEGMPFTGVLYAGVMLTESGPKVLEFNVRFGDPECQPLMFMAGEDLVPWFLAAAQGALPERSPRWREGACCCVVVVSGGYPGRITTGHPITAVPEESAEQVVFYAGAATDGEQVVTSGGRVLSVTAWGETPASAQRTAYAGVELVQFATADWRRDIGG